MLRTAMKKYADEVAKKPTERKGLDLAFDVHFLEGLVFGDFEELTSLVSVNAELVLLLLEKMLAVVITNKLGGIAVGLEAEFFSDES